MSFYKIFAFLGFIGTLFYNTSAFGLDSGNPVSIDSRIKTLVYSENEIFTIVLNYGYHSYIEFSKGENVKVMAMGDSVNWKVKSVDNKLFIMPLEKNGKTNMMVETNKGRSYAFDLICKTDPEGSGSIAVQVGLNVDYSIARDLAYIVRFYYPKTDDEFDLDGIKLPELSPPSQKKMAEPIVDELIKPNSTRNHYDYIARENSEAIVPVELFDDGYLTYFKFPNQNKLIPKIFLKDKGGALVQCEMLSLNNYIVIKGVYSSLFLRHDKKYVEILNRVL